MRLRLPALLWPDRGCSAPHARPRTWHEQAAVAAGRPRPQHVLKGAEPQRGDTTGGQYRGEVGRLGFGGEGVAPDLRMRASVCVRMREGVCEIEYASACAHTGC
jgi:hypothetical protein